MIAVYFSWHDHQRNIEAGHNVAEMLKYIKYSLSPIFLSQCLYFISYTIFKKHFSNNIFLLTSIFGRVVLGYNLTHTKKGLSMARQQPFQIFRKYRIYNCTFVL